MPRIHLRAYTRVGRYSTVHEPCLRRSGRVTCGDFHYYSELTCGIQGITARGAQGPLHCLLRRGMVTRIASHIRHRVHA